MFFFRTYIGTLPKNIKSRKVYEAIYIQDAIILTPIQWSWCLLVFEAKLKSRNVGSNDLALFNTCKMFKNLKSTFHGTIF